MSRQSGRRRGRLATALILIGGGAVLLIAQLTHQWQWAITILGIGFLAGYFRTRNYGLLVPGGILTGVGVGIFLSGVVQEAPEDFEAALFLVPLGLGFILVWVLDMVFTRAGGWWPLIPGGILALIGIAVGVGGVALYLLELLGTWWPVVLILVGGWILFSIWREGPPEAAPSEEDEHETLPGVDG